MYRDYANKICTRTKKSLVTLSLEEEVDFILLSLSLRVPFLRQLMLRVFPSFSLTWDNDSCSDHTFDN
jgi:hypothetical protein